MVDKQVITTKRGRTHLCLSNHLSELSLRNNTQRNGTQKNNTQKNNTQKNNTQRNNIQKNNINKIEHNAGY